MTVATLEVQTITVWKEIEVGGDTVEGLVAKLDAAGVETTDWAKDMMRQPSFTIGPKRKVRLARSTVGKVGFDEQITTNKLWAWIEETFSSLCDSDVGPYLRLALANQPNGDYFWVAMKQVVDSNRDPSIFCVECEHSGKQCLLGVIAEPAGLWYLDDEFVFPVGK